jgi:hypothetical protein
MDEAKKTQTRREGLEISAIDPISGKMLSVIVSYDRLHFIKKQGRGAIMHAGNTVPYILQHPTAIFEGLCFDEDEDMRGVGWRCFCGIPEYDYSVSGEELPSRPNRVFLVFVNIERIAYNWSWVKCDENDKKLPTNYEIRFKKRLI